MGGRLFCEQSADVLEGKGHRAGPIRDLLAGRRIEEIRKIASSTLDLNFPKIIGKNRLMMLEHSEKSGKNTLVLVDEKSGHRINSASLPNGEIDRIKLVQNGKFVFVYYHTKKENYGSIMDSKKIVILRDFKPYFTAKGVLDATIDIDGFSVLTTRHGTNPLTSIFNGEKTSVPIPLPMSKGVRNLATDDNGAVFAFSVLDFHKFSAGIRSLRNPAFQTSVLTGSEKEENDMTLSEFGDFEAMYGNDLWYDHRSISSLLAELME